VAARGDAHAQFQLGLSFIHAVGKGGMPQDFAEAARLWRLSAAQGHECAREALAELACERAYVSACCMGCGAMRKLETCAKCKVAKFCGAECQRRTWAEHKSHCKAWAADPPQAAAAVVDAASREATSSAPDAAAGRRRRLPFHDFISARPYYGWGSWMWCEGTEECEYVLNSKLSGWLSGALLHGARRRLGPSPISHAALRRPWPRAPWCHCCVRH
jgi:hypothetical protein